MKFRTITLATIIYNLLWTACSGPGVSSSGGGGSEITNGHVVTADGHPVSGMVLTAYPIDYIPGRDTGVSAETVTDVNGYFELAFDTNRVNIIGIDSTAKTGLFVDDVNHGDSLGTIHLQELGTVVGNVHVPDTAGYRIAALIRGSPFITFIKPPDSVYRFENVPAARYLLGFFRSEEGVPACTSGSLCNPGLGGGSPSSIIVSPGAETRKDTTIYYDEMPRL